MQIIELIRLEESEQGTIGILKLNKRVFCFTLEPPDRGNIKHISSIPAKQYRCSIYKSHRHGKTYKVEDVPGRTGIIFHAGNIVDNTGGCILLGSSVGKLKNNRAVLNSGKTFDNFMKETIGEILHLTIREVY